MGGEESAGMTIRGHLPEKDGILACLLVTEMVATRGANLQKQLRALFNRVGGEFWPLRTNLHLPDEVKSRTVDRLESNFSMFLGRRVKNLDRTDGVKFEFADGSWILLRLSGTEPVLRIYAEAASLQESTNLTKETESWVMSVGQEAKA